LEGWGSAIELHPLVIKPDKPAAYSHRDYHPDMNLPFHQRDLHQSLSNSRKSPMDNFKIFSNTPKINPAQLDRQSKSCGPSRYRKWMEPVIALSQKSKIEEFPKNGGCRIRTCEGISQQIYSLSRLTASVTPQKILKNPMILKLIARRVPKLLQKWKEPAEGLEPATCGLQNRCSPN
jgi:hypothetical protein